MKLSPRQILLRRGKGGSKISYDTNWGGSKWEDPSSAHATSHACDRLRSLAATGGGDDGAGDRRWRSLAAGGWQLLLLVVAMLCYITILILSSRRGALVAS